MRRTIIEERTTSPTYVEDSSGPALGVMVGVIVGIAVVVLAILFANGTFRGKSSPTPNNNNTTITNNGGGGSPAPAQQPNATP